VVSSFCRTERCWWTMQFGRDVLRRTWGSQDYEEVVKWWNLRQSKDMNEL